jgi:hypothetical protein
MIVAFTIPPEMFEYLVAGYANEGAAVEALRSVVQQHVESLVGQRFNVILGALQNVPDPDPSAIGAHLLSQRARMLRVSAGTVAKE